MSFEQYLRENISNGIIDFAVRATIGENDKVKGYIHPQGKDGTTFDFNVIGNGIFTEEFYKQVWQYAQQHTKNCPKCGKRVDIYKSGRLRRHKKSHGKGKIKTWCMGSGEIIE